MTNTSPLKNIAVIGSGVMGSGIAAQIANAGYDVTLYDIVPDGAEDRNVVAKSAIDRMLKTAPAPLMMPSFAKRITPANLEDDLPLLAECDWIIEVVTERLDIKHQTYEKINAHRKKGSIISSNTSTIPLAKLTEGFDEAFKQDFMITHFFNPPRYLRLLELVTGPETSKQAIQTITDFCDIHLGKGIVRCHDRPGFIANRIGTFWMQTGLNVALEQGVQVDVADSLMGKPLGIPKTALFGLIDLVGVDLIPKLADSLCGSLPKTDQFQDIYSESPLIAQMIEAGYTGRKGKGGFSRMLKSPDGSRQLMVLDIVKAAKDGFDAETCYRPAEKIQLESLNAAKQGIKAIFECDDEGGRYARDVMVQTLGYTAALVPEIADDIAAVDEAMRLGYNWAYGPFQMMDALGADWLISALQEKNLPVADLLTLAAEKGGFYKDHQYLGTDGTYHDIKKAAGILELGAIKREKEALFTTQSAALWDIGEAVMCLEFTGKMNAIDHDVFAAVHKAIEIISAPDSGFKALVLYGNNSLFSAGANLKKALEALDRGEDNFIPELVKAGQDVMMALKYAPFPVVAAPTGLALGGGCEFILHADHVQTHAELYCGLVEVGVGLIPGWGGCKEMILRYQAAEAAQTNQMWFSPANSPMGAVLSAFKLIGTATMATSAAHAKSLGYLKPSDGISMNVERLLFDARQAAIECAADYDTNRSPVDDVRLPGPSGYAAMEMALDDMHKSGKATDYDMIVGRSVARVLSGGEDADWTETLTEETLLDLEYQEFVKLVKNDGTKDRIAHMLKTGKPLRN